MARSRLPHIHIPHAMSWALRSNGHPLFPSLFAARAMIRMLQQHQVKVNYCPSITHFEEHREPGWRVLRYGH